MKYVGARVRAIDWEERTSGSTRYAGDVDVDGLLIGRILRSPHAHARIRHIDVSGALRSPGVRAVITSKDFAPGVRYIHEGAADRPPIADDVVRFVGQEVAAVAADTKDQAEAALDEIRVEYDVLAAPFTIDEALASKAAPLHDRKTGIKNVSARLVRQWGDPERGKQASKEVVEGTYWFPQQAHVCMEPNTTVAVWDDTKKQMHLWTSTHAPYYIVAEVAHALSLDPSQVICHEVAVGGGFGSKSKISEHEAIAAALSRASCRPVIIEFSREEEFATTKSRHAFRVWLRLYADETGKLRTIESRILTDNGAYNHSGVSVVSAGLKAFGMSCYQPDGVEAEALLVDTAKQPGGQFRGYGSTQTGFALECLMDELAEKCGQDPIEFRLRNANHFPATTLSGAEVRSAWFVECLLAARDAIGWQKEKTDRQAGRGVGIAASVHSSGVFTAPGANRSDGAIDVFSSGKILVRFGGADPGTGQKTILRQIAAEELGVDIENVDVLTMESDRTPFDMGAWSSRGTHYGGHAVRMTAIEAAGRLKKLAAQRLGDGVVRLESGMAVNGDRRIPIGELIALSNEAADGVLTTECSYVESTVVRADPKTGYGNGSASYNYAAHAVIASVDRRTGRIRILDYVAAHDVGTAINPQFVEGQISGGAAMGLGAAMGEELIYQAGKLVNPAYLHYAMPRAADLPRIRTMIVGGKDPLGPYGAKAVGECSINPPAAALANAVYDAIGVRIRDLPITPDKILRALAAERGEQRRFKIWRRPARWWIALVRWAYPRGLFDILHRRSWRVAKRSGPNRVKSMETPAAVADVVNTLGPDAMVVGGGTDVQLQRRAKLSTPTRLISLLDVADLQKITSENDGTIVIGAAVSLDRIGREFGQSHPVLNDVVEQIASPQIRAMATLGGNLIQQKRCWFYRNDFPCFKRNGGMAPCYAITGDHRFYHAAIDGHRCQAVTPSDLATALVALDAVAVIVGRGGNRQVPMESFYTGPGETVLRPDEILSHMRLPARSNRQFSAYEKLRLWQGDFAIASAAIAADIDVDGRWRNSRIVFGGIAPTPWRARRTEKALDGTVVSTARLRFELDRELNAVAHPLPNNGWKLDAAAGLAENVADRLRTMIETRATFAE